MRKILSISVDTKNHIPEGMWFWRSERDLNPRAAFDRLLP